MAGGRTAHKSRPVGGRQQRAFMDTAAILPLLDLA